MWVPRMSECQSVLFATRQFQLLGARLQTLQSVNTLTTIVKLKNKRLEFPIIAQCYCVVISFTNAIGLINNLRYVFVIDLNTLLYRFSTQFLRMRLWIQYFMIRNDREKFQAFLFLQIFKNRCSHSGCKKKELMPIVCPECGLNYCIPHRHPNDHNCSRTIKLSAGGAGKQPSSSNGGLLQALRDQAS